MRLKLALPLSLRHAMPKFDAAKPEQNLIAIALWGSSPCYLHGALANARLTKEMFPGWTCRFQIGPGVPAKRARRFARYGAQLVDLPPFRFATEGMLWRFRAWEDRASGALSDPRRRLRVHRQGAGGGRSLGGIDKPFHAMRGHMAHSELMLRRPVGRPDACPAAGMDALLQGVPDRAYGGWTKCSCATGSGRWSRITSWSHDCVSGKRRSTAPLPPHPPAACRTHHVGQGITKGLTHARARAKAGRRHPSVLGAG